MRYPYEFLDRIIQGDCLDILRQIPDESVDLIFADPPFNMNKAYKDNRANYREWVGKWISECFRVLKSTGSFYHMTLTRHLEWKLPLMAAHGIFINLISWRNVSSAHNKRTFWPEYQPIMLYGKSENYTFNTYVETDMNLLASATHESTMFRWGEYNTERRGQLKDRWDFIPFVYAGSITHPEAILEPGTNKKAHPCQMPLKLATRAIFFSTNHGDIVIDPFSGIGTTAVAAIKAGRRYIAIEIERKFCRLAEERIETELSEPDLPGLFTSCQSVTG